MQWKDVQGSFVALFGEWAGESGIVWSFSPICFELEVHSSGFESLEIALWRQTQHRDGWWYFLAQNEFWTSVSKRWRLGSWRSDTVPQCSTLQGLRWALSSGTCYRKEKKEDDHRGQTDWIQISFCCRGSLFEVLEVLCGAAWLWCQLWVVREKCSWLGRFKHDLQHSQGTRRVAPWQEPVEVLLIVLEPVEGDIVGIVRGVTWSCSHAILFDIDRWCEKKMAAL